MYLYIASYYIFHLSTKAIGVRAKDGKETYPKSNALSIEIIARKVMGIQGTMPSNTARKGRAKSRLLGRSLGDGLTMLTMNQEKNSATAGHVMDLGEK